MSDPVPRVLVVEDEELLLNLLKRLLEREGWGVVAARSGDEALRVFCAEPAAFDAAILDVGVPPRGALDTLQALRAVRPDLGAILTSGIGPDASVRAELREGRSTFVPKPFAPGDLARALERVRRAA